MQASKEATKAVPMINGVEVKVGQIWRDGAGLVEEVCYIDYQSPEPIETNPGNKYSCNGKHWADYPENHLVQLVKDVEKEQAFTRSELSALIEVNSYKIRLLNARVEYKKDRAKVYYSLCDKSVKETSPYFVELNKARNEIKKDKAKLKKLVAIQCKLKEMYNSSK